MNHALLPSIEDASLPAKYEAAKLALSECNRIDECKDWADKAMALASYAKQANDTVMENTAMRIRARAIRRCGELLKEIEKATTGPKQLGGDAPTQLGRMGTAAKSGMSKDQAVTAIRVANVNGESFEQQVESSTPPTITSLAEQGKRQGVPHYVQRGMTIQAFQAGMYFSGHLSYFAQRTSEYDPQDVADGLLPEEREQIRHNIGTIDSYFDKLMAKL